jgi:hypothetical protein
MSPEVSGSPGPLRGPGYIALQATAIIVFRQGSVVKKSPYQLEQSHRVTLSEAKGLSRSAERSFASLRMTGLTLSVGEELSRSFEPCLMNF